MDIQVFGAKDDELPVGHNLSFKQREAVQSLRSPSLWVELLSTWGSAGLGEQLLRHSGMD